MSSLIKPKSFKGLRYERIVRETLRDGRIGAEGRSILFYLMSHDAKKWEVSLYDIKAKLNMSERAVQRGMRQLEAYGYARLLPRRRGGGIFFGRTWEVSMLPIFATTDKAHGAPSGKATDKAAGAPSGKVTDKAPSAPTTRHMSNSAVTDDAYGAPLKNNQQKKNNFALYRGRITTGVATATTTPVGQDGNVVKLSLPWRWVVVEPCSNGAAAADELRRAGVIAPAPADDYNEAIRRALAAQGYRA